MAGQTFYNYKTDTKDSHGVGTATADGLPVVGWGDGGVSYILIPYVEAGFDSDATPLPTAGSTVKNVLGVVDFRHISAALGITEGATGATWVMALLQLKDADLTNFDTTALSTWKAAKKLVWSEEFPQGAKTHNGFPGLTLSYARLADTDTMNYVIALYKESGVAGGYNVSMRVTYADKSVKEY